MVILISTLTFLKTYSIAYNICYRKKKIENVNIRSYVTANLNSKPRKGQSAFTSKNVNLRKGVSLLTLDDEIPYEASGNDKSRTNVSQRRGVSVLSVDDLYIDTEGGDFYNSSDEEAESGQFTIAGYKGTMVTVSLL